MHARGARQPDFDFWTDPMEAIRRAYHRTDRKVLKMKKAGDDEGEGKGKGNGNGRRRLGGSTAVTVILINGETLVVANVGDSRAVLGDAGGAARQLSVDHEPLRERGAIESRGGFVTEVHGTPPLCLKCKIADDGPVRSPSSSTRRSD